MQTQNPVLNRITAFCHNHTLLPQGSTVVLGLSGGPDSVFLLHFLASLHHAQVITLIAAHLDHQWRLESVDDARWCVQAAEQLGIACIVGRLSDFTHTIAWNGSQEEVGRRARRLFLEQTAREYHANRIALAHHAQDQQETFFIRMLRGAAIHGLTGMKPHHGLYIRPLLETNKADILNYLHTHALPYLTDSSNNSLDYLRNRIRHTVLPALQNTDDRFDHNFKKLLTHLQKTQEYINSQAQHALEAIGIPEDNVYKLNIPQLLVLHPVIQQQTIITWLIDYHVPFTPSQALFEEILRFAKNGSGTHSIHTACSLTKKKEWLWVTK